MSNIALIIAGGIGARMGQDIPKQFINVHDKPVIVYTMEAFQKHPQIDAIEVVCLEGWHDVLRAYAKQFGIAKLEGIVTGGINGQDSIRNGLYDIAKKYNWQEIKCVENKRLKTIEEIGEEIYTLVKEIL